MNGSSFLATLHSGLKRERRLQPHLFRPRTVSPQTVGVVASVDVTEGPLCGTSQMLSPFVKGRSGLKLRPHILRLICPFYRTRRGPILPADDRGESPGETFADGQHFRVKSTLTGLMVTISQREVRMPAAHLAPLFNFYLPILNRHFPLGTPFDSHDFIQKLTRAHQSEYVKALNYYTRSGRLKPFKPLHNALARLLRSPGLSVTYVGRINSDDIFGDDVSNANWMRA